MLSYNVADLLRAPPGTSEQHEVDVATVPLADTIELAAPVRGRLRLTSSGRGILVQGHLETALAERCSRCLRPARSQISLDLEEEALPSIELESGLPIDTSAEPDAIRLSDHHELELGAAVADAIALAEPIAPLCRPDCPGLCATCGADLSVEVGHGHPETADDPWLAALAEIRERLS
jgi:uncharacterized protein